MATSSRPFQLAVWGATGFVGKLVCERIATEYPNQLRVVLAGRDRRKLESVREEMTKHDPSCKDLEIMVANSDDREAIDAITKSVEVVLSCAGPYRKYSSVMVASCVANRTHYVDTSVEMPWIRSNIRSYHEQALQNETKLVHFCATSSLPYELGTLLVVQTIRQRYQTGCRRVEMWLELSDTGLSGGTMATVVDILASTNDTERHIVLNDPYCLTPQHLDVPSGRRNEGICYNEDIHAYLVPALFSNVNAPPIQRSNALAPEPYGKDFICCERVKASNLPAAWIANCCEMLFRSLSGYSFFQKMIEMTAPNPGSGPSIDAHQNEGSRSINFIGYPEDPNAKTVFAKMEATDTGTGYRLTSKLLVECALCLILEKEKVDQEAPLKGGVLTPATAFGCVPLDRLKNQGSLMMDMII